jgi:O-antigen ligase
VVVGWNRGSGLFAPLAVVRSVGDASIDLSTQWREIENWNICASIRAHPIAGIGLGGEYTEHMRNASLTGLYSDFRAWPHNSVLGLILLCGAVAFAALWSLFAFTVYLAVRAYRATDDPDLRVAALTCVAAVIGCLVMAYGDTGANLSQYRIFGGLALAVAAKLSVTTGAWPATPGRSGPFPNAEGRGA